MPFNTSLAHSYRPNGNMVIIYDFRTRYYDLYLNHPSGRLEMIEAFTNKVNAIKEAKKQSMERKVGFNEILDIVS